jgi:hypothetical protein
MKSGLDLERLKQLGAPDRPAEVVAAWDAGRVIWTVEMGGLGPGYEQTIQTLVVELLRSAGGPPEGGWEADT